MLCFRCESVYWAGFHVYTTLPTWDRLCTKTPIRDFGKQSRIYIWLLKFIDFPCKTAMSLSHHTPKAAISHFMFNFRFQNFEFSFSWRFNIIVCKQESNIFQQTSESEKPYTGICRRITIPSVTAEVCLSSGWRAPTTNSELHLQV